MQEQEDIVERINQEFCIKCGEVGLTEKGKFIGGHRCPLHVVTVEMAEIMMYKCPVCRLQLCSPEQMLFHHVSIHGGLTGVMCPLKGCHRTYLHDCLYERHIRDHHMSKADFNRRLNAEWGPCLPWTRKINQ